MSLYLLRMVLKGVLVFVVAVGVHTLTGSHILAILAGVSSSIFYDVDRDLISHG